MFVLFILSSILFSLTFSFDSEYWFIDGYALKEHRIRIIHHILECYMICVLSSKYQRSHAIHKRNTHNRMRLDMILKPRPRTTYQTKSLFISRIASKQKRIHINTHKRKQNKKSKTEKIPQESETEGETVIPQGYLFVSCVCAFHF